MSTGRQEHVSAGGHAVCLRDQEIKQMIGIAHDTHKRLFVDGEVDCVQTMLVKGEARMEELAKGLIAANARITAHEERPKKVVGFLAVVIPLVLVVGGAIYKVTCWILDHFQWRLAS